MNALTPIVFRSVTEIDAPLPLSIGLSGGSGTGKTYTALCLARGIAREMTGREDASIGYVDTENRRALHYAKAFPEMLHFDMRAVDHQDNMVGFPPERWIEVIDAAEAAKMDVLVLDSFSHEWEGVNGILDLQAQALHRLTGGNDSKKNQFGQLAWAEIKPRHRRLIDRIVRAKVPVIICTRAKPVMQAKSKDSGWKLENARDTKTRRKDVPWDPASDGDLMFEMTAMVILDPVAPGHPVHQIKVADQFKNLLDARDPMTVDTGKKMAAWAKGNDEGARLKRVMDMARAEARKGSAAFATWWNLDSTKGEVRKTVSPIRDELANIARRADADADSLDGDDPLAGRGDPALTPEQIAARDAAYAEMKARGNGQPEEEGDDD